MKFGRQLIWKQHEIPVAEHLMSFAESIRDEFMAGFSSLEEAAKSKCVNVIDPSRHEVDDHGHTDFLVSQDETKQWAPSIESWKAVGFKFTRHDDRKVVNLRISEEEASKFPSAYKLFQHYDDICPMMSLNVLAPHTILHRHFGPENIEGKFIRIHIPLIIPPGDIFLEVAGEEVTWDSLFGFDNTVTHSAHNYTDFFRLIVLIDLDREAIGLPPGLPYDPQLEKTIPPFVRGFQW
jgi:hypothetical protein